ncbi:MAG: hypothetical protein EOL90_08055 [Spartobacteria bacterium]|nr:hypothetical protein [Spartobacteria bacterium]
MNATGALILLVGLIVFGASIRGLFNRGRSIVCAAAGILVALGAGLGAWIAWMESNSAIGTAIYLVIVLVGIVAVVRQIKPRQP